MAKFPGFGTESTGHIKRNFVLNVIDGSVFSFGMNFISLTTILPVLVKQLGGSNISVGLIPVVWTIGFNFPQILIANYTKRHPKKKSIVMVTSLIQRFPWLILSLFAYFFFSHLETETTLLLFFAGFAIAAVGGAINLPAWFDLIFKITPVQLRGRLFALRLTLGAVLGIISGWVSKVVLDSISYPDSFSILFLFAFIVMMISYFFLSQIKEEAVSPSTKLVKYKVFLLSLPSILKNQKNYRSYLIGDAFMISAGMAHGFFTVCAFSKFSLTPGYAGQFTIVMMTATIIGSLLFGTLADKLGHRLNLIFASIFIFSASILAILSDSVELYHLVFIFSALTLALMQVSRLTIIAELSNEDERATYVALTNLITVPFTSTGILAGIIANKFGYEPVFLISSVFALFAFFSFKFMMKEPRQKQAPTFIDRI